MANSEYNYIPTYIRRTINNRPKDVVTAKYWNELFNLLITQGDHTAEELGNILNYFSTRLVGVESEIAESAEAIANIRGAFRINVTSSNGVYSADKTFEEIKAAYDAGLLPFVVYGGDTIYTLSSCYFASEHMFMDFERYLIWEDTLATETLRIYSFTTDSGSNVARRTEEFNVPSGATYIAVDATGDAISTVNGETYADIQALIDAGKPVVVRWDDLGDFYYFETFRFSDSSGTHKRLNFRCVMGSIVYTLTLRDDNTWVFRETSLQTNSITDTGGYFTTDTVEGALQEIGAGLTGAVKSVNGKTGAVVLNASDVGAISQNDLQTATNEALAQAKASGEFDGADGRDGITPTIGENGNWYLGVTDTGKPSRGKDGADGATGAAGTDGKSAYQYAVEGGYTGTEAEFAKKLASEALIVTITDNNGTLSANKSFIEIKNAIVDGIPVLVDYGGTGLPLITLTADALYFGTIQCDSGDTSNGAVVATMMIKITLNGEVNDISAFVEALPNPNAITFTGAVTGSYDGSAPLSVNIPTAPTKTSQLTNDAGYLTLATLPKYEGVVE